MVLCFLIVAATTHDQDVFSFYPDDSFCNDFEEVLMRYREIVPQLRLAGLDHLTNSSSSSSYACVC